jgi:hypothetical protein
MSASKEDYSLVSSSSPERAGVHAVHLGDGNKLRKDESPFLAFSDLGNSVIMDNQMTTHGKGFYHNSTMNTGRKQSQ